MRGIDVAKTARMMLMPYRTAAPRTLALPRRDVACTDGPSCACALASPKELFSHRTWRAVWLCVAALVGAGAATISLASAIPRSTVDPVYRAQPRRASYAPPRAAMFSPVARGQSIFGGAVSHDPETLLEVARAEQHAGMPVTLVDVIVSPSAADGSSLSDELGLARGDVIVSDDGWQRGAPSERRGWSERLIELDRDGKRVVMMVRRANWAENKLNPRDTRSPAAP